MVDTTPPTVSFTPLTATPSTSPRTLVATVSDNLAVANVTVFYAINGGSFTSAACTNGGPASYACPIPGNPSGTTVTYYVTAIDTATNSSTVPSSATPDLYTVGPASVPAGEYSSISLADGSSFAGNILVDNNLDLEGIINAGSFTVTLACGGTVSVAGPNAYVIGKFEKVFCGAGAFTFPIGTTPSTTNPAGVNGPQPAPPAPPQGASPFTANVTSAAPGSSLVVFAVDGDMPGATTASSASRYWDVTQTGSITADISYTYLDQDVNGTEANYKVLKRESGITAVVAGGTVDAGTNTASVSGVSSFSQWGAGVPLGTTAAAVSVGGRVLTSDGRGIANVVITVEDDALGQPLTTRTNAFGYYRFEGLATGRSYVVTANARHFTFAQPSVVVSPRDTMTDLNFTAQP
jgi:hypothetical protein